MQNHLFITGMFRSGTTLLARMLHTHRDIACASDPYRPFFNCLRDSIADEFDIEIEPYDPLGSYFADEDEYALFDRIQSATLDRQFDRDSSTLRDRIESHGEPFSPKIIENLDNIQGETFEEIYRNLLAKVSEYYGDNTEKWIATKEVWTTEFVPALSRTFPDSKFILVVRDPRAVAASNNADEDRKYPWIFLARQWRKIAILSWVYSTQAEFRDRVQVVRYEDLVQSPRATADEMCKFLGIDLDERVLDPSNFVDGRGKQWLQNTTYGEGKASFNTDSIDKWERILDEKTVHLLEQLCYIEMQQFDYSFEKSTRYGFTDELILDPPVVSPEEMADWIVEYYDRRTQVSARSELGSEHIRQRMVRCDDATCRRLNTETVQTYFLNEPFFEASRDRIQS